MLYWIIFIVLFYLSYKEIRTRRINKKYFLIMWYVLSLMALLREGQGTDYYNYKEIYIEIGTIEEFSPILLFTIVEPGYFLLNLLFVKLNIPYTIFASFFSLLILYIIYPFFKKQCSCSIIALFMFYASSFYIPYFFNQWRQAFVVAIFLRIFPLLLNGKYKQFCAWIFIAATFHISSLILLISPIIAKIRIGKNLTLLLSVICVIFLFINPFELLIHNLNFVKINNYLGNEVTSSKYLAWIVRLILILPVFLINDKIYKKNKELRVVRNFLISGFLIFCVFSFSELIASRLNIYFRVLEWYFAVFIIHKTNLKIISRQICYCYILFISILFAKDIKSSISQGEYNNCNIFTYPYLSIFDSKDTIEYYRSHPLIRD